MNYNNHATMRIYSPSIERFANRLHVTHIDVFPTTVRPLSMILACTGYCCLTFSYLKGRGGSIVSDRNFWLMSGHNVCCVFEMGREPSFKGLSRFARKMVKCKKEGKICL